MTTVIFLHFLGVYYISHCIHSRHAKTQTVAVSVSHDISTKLHEISNFPWKSLICLIISLSPIIAYHLYICMYTLFLWWYHDIGCSNTQSNSNTIFGVVKIVKPHEISHSFLGSNANFSWLNHGFPMFSRSIHRTRTSSEVPMARTRTTAWRMNSSKRRIGRR